MLHRSWCCSDKLVHQLMPASSPQTLGHSRLQLVLVFGLTTDKLGHHCDVGLEVVGVEEHLSIQNLYLLNVNPKLKSLS